MSPPTSVLISLDTSRLISFVTNQLMDFRTFINDPRELAFFCSNIILPGFSYNTIDNAMNTNSRKYITGYNNEDVSMTFIVTNDFYIPHLFNSWQSVIIDKANYRLRYKSTYTTDIYMAILDNNDNPVYTILLKGAFPISFEAIPYNQGEENTYQTITVTFSYDDFTDTLLFDAQKRVDGLISDAIGFLKNTDVFKGVSGAIAPVQDTFRDVVGYNFFDKAL